MCMYVYTCQCVYVILCLLDRANVFNYMCMFYVRVYVYMYECLYVLCMCILCMYICTYVSVSCLFYPV